MTFLSSCRRHPVIVSAVGVLLILLGITMGIAGPSAIIKYARYSQLALRPDSASYDKWANSHIRISAFVFNITNPLEVLSGAKPIVDEVGPFVYMAHQKKVNITFKDDDHVEYTKTYTVVFDSERSVGPEDTTVYTLNGEFAAMLYKIDKEGYDVLKKNLLVFAGRQEKGFMRKLKAVFVQRSIKELFHGYKGLIQTRFFKDKPSPYFLVPHNNSEYGPSIVNTGRSDYSQLNTLTAYKNQSIFPYWNDTNCQQIPPGLRAEPNLGPNLADDADSVSLFMFWSRGMKWLLNDSHINHNVHGYDLDVNRFVADSSFYQNGLDNPENRCYDSQMISPDGYEPDASGNSSEKTETKVKRGMPSGVFDMSPMKDAPVLMSNPHFIHGDPYFKESIDGLKPDPSIHFSEWLIQPDTGVTVRFKNQFQINLILMPDRETLSSLKVGVDNVTATIYPIVWMEHETILPESAASKIFMATKTAHSLSHIAGSLITLTGLVLVLLSIRAATRSSGKKITKTRKSSKKPIVKYPEVRPHKLEPEKMDPVTDVPGPETQL